ncbi:MAG: hypothetical protein HC888_00655 [Candidatus Competibacteraceae bacterium]|nr:hypothetical protein [Candidatus Competibacteraceae bacterium]
MSELKLEGDSIEYDILERAAKHVACVPGLFCEVGVRRGRGTEVMMRSSPVPRNFVCIDPYGSIPYYQGDNIFVNYTDYDAKMKHETIAQLHLLALELGHNMIFMPFSFEDCQRMLYEGLNVYHIGGRHWVGSFALVHLDAQHKTDKVIEQITFMAYKIPRDGILVIDDVDKMDAQEINKWCEKHKLIPFEMGKRKHAYISVRKI